MSICVVRQAAAPWLLKDHSVYTQMGGPRIGLMTVFIQEVGIQQECELESPC